MGWDFCNRRIVKKTRKPHRCAYCKREIPAGAKKILNWAGLFECDFQNSYACHWCQSHMNDLQDDEYIGEFWDDLTDNIFYDEFKKYKECDCTTDKGFVGNIKAEFDGDYLVWKCKDCGKVWHKEYMPVAREE